MLPRVRHTRIAGLLLLAYACLQVYCLHRLSLNYDEGSFAAYGRTLLKGEGNKDILRYDSKLPITALNMLPRAVEQVFHPGLKKSSNTEDVMRGRYISLLAMLLLALLVYRWSSELYGERAGLFSLLLLLLCPNFLAHGIFLSSDIFACLFMALSLYHCWRFRHTRGTRHFVYMSLAVALAQVSKFSMVHLVILIAVLLLIGWLSGEPGAGSPESGAGSPESGAGSRESGAGSLRFSVRSSKFRGWKRSLGLLLIFVFTNWLVICAAHLFYGMFVPLGDYHFSSPAFQHLQAALGWLPVPLPSSYVGSLDIVMYYDRLGGGVPGALNGAPYMLGTHSVHGLWYYYFVALWYKLPLPVLLLLALTVVAYLRKGGAAQFLRQEIYLILPALYYLIYMNFFYATQVGIRHIIIILPLLYIFIGFFVARLQTPRARVFGYALLLYECVSVGLRFPHFLPYTNELIADKKMAYMRLADTNICYGEGEPFLFDYLHRHPGSVYEPDSIRAGRVVMEVNDVLDLSMGTMGKYDWVAPLRPVDHIHSQYLVYEISASLADSLNKAKTR